jgi:AcrR family transcriptional regulator
VPRRTAEESEATRAELVAVARRLFGERGYSAVGTEEIVAAAGVTRGALYHHFRDKRDLFRAVFAAQEQAFLQQVGERLLPIEDPYERLQTGLAEVLSAYADDQALARIAFGDGPSVLGFEQWRAIVEEYSLGLLVFMLQEAMDAHRLRRLDPEPLAHVILGALTEGGMLLASGADPEPVRASLRAVLEGLRAPG